MAVRTKNERIAKQTRAIQQISSILDDFDAVQQKRILEFVADSLGDVDEEPTSTDEPIPFPLETAAAAE